MNGRTDGWTPDGPQWDMVKLINDKADTDKCFLLVNTEVVRVI